MATQTIPMTDALHAYLLRVSPPLSALQTRLREETAQLPDGGFQISAEQGHFLAFLLRALGARKCLEIGTFTGYSSLITALALPDDGTLICCDVSDEFTQMARRYWQEAGVADKIALRLGPALDTLQALLDDGHAGTFDWIFIDADKPNYLAYYEMSLTLLRVGGTLGVDNTLWSGRVADPSVTDVTTATFRTLNAKIAGDERVDRTVVPIGDGLTLCRKR